jgi:L-alanine-DL-glutamate epimerase-like enolase superfamily enzyme
MSSSRVDRVRASAYRIPTDQPESDGTLEWDATTVVVVEVGAGDQRGLGYCYADAGAAGLASAVLAAVIDGADAMDTRGSWLRMVRAVRNVGRHGIAASAVAAVDVALWDLKARLLDVSLLDLLGGVRDSVEVYGSGGFTSYPVEVLSEQLAGWAELGIRSVKMKVGRCPQDDPRRVLVARRAIGDGVALMVDANGAYSRKQALAQAERFAEHDVTWFEEPVSSDDLDGLRLMRDRVPGGMEVAAGEYGYDLPYFRRMLAAGAVDVLQADATRCAGITGLLGVGALCEAWSLPLSTHTAPALHAQVCCALPALRHLEWFHDHVRIERLLFDGAPEPADGHLVPDRSRPGLGLEFKHVDAQRYLLREATG